MNILSLPLALLRKVNSTVDGMRKQAPAARMVGEFAVKHVANEANKKISDLTGNSDGSTTTGQTQS